MSGTSHLPGGKSIAVVFLLLALSSASLAQIVVVPARPDPLDENVPIIAWSGRPIALRAAVKGLDPSSMVYYHWDVDGDGVWDRALEGDPDIHEGMWYLGPTKGLCLHFTRTVTQNTSCSTIVQVSQSPGTGPVYSAGMPTAILTGFPDPATDTQWAEDLDDTQRNIALQIFRDDLLWHLHEAMYYTGTPGSSSISGYLYGNSTEPRDALTVTALYLLALLESGHYPAYPPGSYDDMGQPYPQDFPTLNDTRWYQDIYAEDAVRLMNFLLYHLQYNISIPADDEGDDGGPAIPGTNDQRGWAVWNTFTEQSPNIALALAALARTGLQGTVAQLGSLTQGKSLEFIVQQMVDYLVAAQLDANSPEDAEGAWYYSPCLDCGSPAPYAHGQLFGWAVYALHAAEQAMGTAGVYVNDRVRYRLPNVMWHNQYTDGGTRYTNAASNSWFEPVGHLLLACRWLGWDQFENGDGTSCGYPDISLTRGQARYAFDRYLQYATTKWTQGGSGALNDPTSVLWSDGDYTSGNRTHTWWMALWSTTHGIADGDTLLLYRPWTRQFGVDLLYQSYDRLTGTWYDYVGSPYHYTNNYLGTNGQTCLAALTATAAILPDTTAPALPTTFSVQYGPDYNTMSWSSSPSSDALKYRIYFGSDGVVPIDQSHLLVETTGTSGIDPYGMDPWRRDYRLVAVDCAGNASAPMAPTQITAARDDLPTHVNLGDPYPNPFNPSVRVPFVLPEAARASLRVYDAQGKLVAALLDDRPLPAGEHVVRWDGRRQGGGAAPSGLYLFRLRVGDVVQERRALLVK